MIQSCLRHETYVLILNTILKSLFYFICFVMVEPSARQRCSITKTGKWLPISKCLQVSTMFASLTAGLIKKSIHVNLTVCLTLQDKGHAQAHCISNQTQLDRRDRGRMVVGFTTTCCMYICNQCPLPLKLWVRFPLITRCTLYAIML